MKKQHFIFLGKAGLIYYSWMFVVLFVSLIIAYENNASISWPGIIVFVMFLIILIYTILTSYWNQDYLRLPFKRKTKISSRPQLVKQLWKFNIYEVNLNSYQKYYIFCLNAKNNKK